MKRFLLYITLMLTAFTGAFAQGGVRVGAENFSAYLPLLRGRKVAVVSNQTGVVPVHSRCADGTDSLSYAHIVDALLDSGITITKIFSPEHGFRGQAEAGATVSSGKDAKTGLPVVSLYGRHKKPTADDLQGVDFVLFDLQDVGVRFYTYISTLHYVMEACAENRLPVVVLDRPNPHAGYTDGPLLDTSCCRSFVGMHPVPVVYGMTVGEYARMINGERWLSGGLECALQVVPVENYTRNTAYAFPVPPSPNLRSMKAVYAYPSLCFFEGTPLSVGRGTYRAFECAGFPGSSVGDYRFTPRSLPGLSANPPFKDEECTGFYVPDGYTDTLPRKLDLSYLLELYRAYPQKDRFFNAFFVKLAGTPELAAQIREGRSEEEIRRAWRPALRKFGKIRQKYLLYR
ncbi:MAG: DUF1343 domain-containing protein [Bacteroides sp.]|nr:DUF1343 domain-containing protein [Bacteroides sp.]